METKGSMKAAEISSSESDDDFVCVSVPDDDTNLEELSTQPDDADAVCLFCDEKFSEDKEW